ncbi:MAG: hypothetical protein ACR2OD_08070, partial [Gaiellaceae bacterium]
VNLLGILRRLDEAGVEVVTTAVPDRVEVGQLVLKHSFSGRAFAGPGVATAVRAGPLAPAAELDVGSRVLIVVGDALSPRGMHAVALEAHRAAIELGRG